MAAPRLKPGATVWVRDAKSRLLFASFLVEGVIQTSTGLVGDKANLNLPTPSAFYRGRNGLSPQRVFGCSDLVAASLSHCVNLVKTQKALDCL